MATMDRRLAQLARLNSSIKKTRKLIDQQMRLIEPERIDTSDDWVLLVRLEESLATKPKSKAA